MLSVSSPDQRPLAEQAVPLLRQGLLAQAATMARAGQYDAAADLLRDRATAPEPDLAALDLLARIRAQQGAYLQAERLWQLVLRSDPAYPGVVAALARLHRVRRSKPWLTPAATAVCAVAVVAAVSGAMHHITVRNADGVAEVRAILVREQTSIGQLQEQVARFRGDNAVLRAELTQAQQDALAGAARQSEATLGGLQALRRDGDANEARMLALEAATAERLAGMPTRAEMQQMQQDAKLAATQQAAAVVAQVQALKQAADETDTQLQGLSDSQTQLATRLQALETMTADRLGALPTRSDLEKFVAARSAVQPMPAAAADGLVTDTHTAPAIQPANASTSNPPGVSATDPVGSGSSH